MKITLDETEQIDKVEEHLDIPQILNHLLECDECKKSLALYIGNFKLPFIFEVMYKQLLDILNDKKKESQNG